MSAARRAAGAATDCGEWAAATDAADGGFAANRAADGGGGRTRTGDIQLGKLTLYQLSYARSDAVGGGK